MKINKSLIILLFSFFSLLQSGFSQIARDDINLADEAFKDGDYYQASLAIHSNLTEAIELRCYFNLLYFDIVKKESLENKEMWKGMDKSIENQIYYRFDVRNL